MYFPPASASPNRLGMLTENLLFRKHLLGFSQSFPGIHSRVPHFPADSVPSSRRLKRRKQHFWYNHAPCQEAQGPCSLVGREFKALRSFASREMSMRKLGVGVLGVGEMGKRHAENLRRLVPEAHLVGVADVDAPRASKVAAELEIEHSFGSFEALLDRKEIHAVVIAAPDKFHGHAIRTAAAAKKDILCEKPMALDLDDARAALKAVSDAGVRLQIGFMRRYDPAYAAAKTQIEAGEIGDPVIFKSCLLYTSPSPRDLSTSRMPSSA